MEPEEKGNIISSRLVFRYLVAALRSGLSSLFLLMLLVVVLLGVSISYLLPRRIRRFLGQRHILAAQTISSKTFAALARSTVNLHLVAVLESCSNDTTIPANQMTSMMKQLASIKPPSGQTPVN